MFGVFWMSCLRQMWKLCQTVFVTATMLAWSPYPSKGPPVMLAVDAVGSQSDRFVDVSN